MKSAKTRFAPKDKPLLIWDGHCGFCAWWVARWEEITGDKLKFETSQSASPRIEDIEASEFQRAVFLLEPDGTVYSGAGAAYRSLYIGDKYRFLFKWYRSSVFFRRLSESAYRLVADHREFFFRITKLMFGSDPHNTKPFWVIYLLLIFYLIYYIGYL